MVLVLQSVQVSQAAHWDPDFPFLPVFQVFLVVLVTLLPLADLSLLLLLVIPVILNFQADLVPQEVLVVLDFQQVLGHLVGHQVQADLSDQVYLVDRFHLYYQVFHLYLCFLADLSHHFVQDFLADLANLHLQLVPLVLVVLVNQQTRDCLVVLHFLKVQAVLCFQEILLIHWIQVVHLYQAHLQPQEVQVTH